MSDHALLSASGSHRWLNCPGSVDAEKGYKDSGSIHALEGTRAHDLAELCFDNDCFADEYLGSELDGGVIDDDMVHHINGYISYVREMCKGADHFDVEQRLDFSRIVPNGFGTSDVVAIKGNQLIIIDLKYGKGIEVSAEDNPQLMLYALGALDEYDWLTDIDEVVMCIYQPRKNNVSEFSMTAAELDLFGEFVAERAKLALSGNAPREPGETQCQWCKAKATCPALHEYTQQVIGAEFDDLDAMDNPDAIPVTSLKLILDNKKLIEGYLSAVEKHAMSLAEENKLPGYKLVEGRSQRRWKDEQIAVKVLSEQYDDSDLYERKFVSPAKAEKLLGKKGKEQLNDLVEKPRGKPTLAPESDKRKPIGDCSDDFENIA